MSAITLSEFLLARIAEDEEMARDAAQVESDDWWVDGPAEASGKHWVYATGEKFAARPIADHIARHDPKRVLAECEAKRRIVEMQAVNDVARYLPSFHYKAQMIEQVLRVLAESYADHPDYRAARLYEGSAP